MKYLLHLSLLFLLVSCGDNDNPNKGGGNDGIPPNIPRLTGARPLTLAEIKTYSQQYHNQANSFDIGLCYTDTSEAYTFIKEQNGQKTKCHYKEVMEKCIVKVTDKDIISFVDSHYSDVTPKTCEEFFSSSQYIEKQAKNCFFDPTDLDITKIPDGVTVSAGTYNGKLHILMDYKGEGGRFISMMDPTRSYYEQSIAEYMKSTGEYIFERSSRNSPFRKEDVSQINIDNFPTSTITCTN